MLFVLLCSSCFGFGIGMLQASGVDGQMIHAADTIIADCASQSHGAAANTNTCMQHIPIDAIVSLVNILIVVYCFRVFLLFHLSVFRYALAHIWLYIKEHWWRIKYFALQHIRFFSRGLLHTKIY